MCKWLFKAYQTKELFLSFQSLKLHCQNLYKTQLGRANSLSLLARVEPVLEALDNEGE